MSTPAIVRPAASLVVVRAAQDGVEILLMKRADKGDQNSGVWVFPGGLVDAGDRRCHPFCKDLDDEDASARLGVAQGGLDHYVAAIRECFEESGLLLAVDEHDRFVDLQADTGARLAALRGPLQGGELDFSEVCRDHGLRLATHRLFYIAHWLTPPGLPKRYDTRFFLAMQPQGQVSGHDAIETLDHVWLHPAELLEPQNARRMLKVTRSIIEMIGRFTDMDALRAWACSPREVPLVMQRRCVDDAGPRTIMPHEPAWAEIGRLDPLGDGTAWCKLRPGVPVRLSPRVLRLTHRAEAAGNSYLVGSESVGWAAIDPGPADQTHIEALVTASAGRILWILLTAGAESSGAAVLAGLSGAQTRSSANAGESVALSNDITLRPLFRSEEESPLAGYLLVEEKTLFTGPCTTHAAALQSWLQEGLEWVAPDQGFLIPMA